MLIAVTVRPRAPWLWVMMAGCWTGPSTPAAEPVAQPAPVVAPRAVDDTPPSPARVAATLATMQGFSERMCQCFDKACSDQVVEDMVAWSQEMAKTPDVNAQLSDDDRNEIVRVSEALTACMVEIMKRSMPPPGPAQPVTTP